MSKRLAKFKSKYMSVLVQLKNELLQKYPDKADRINYIIDILMHKLYALKSHAVPDYLHTVYLTCKEFTELCTLIPSEKDVDELLKND